MSKKDEALKLALSVLDEVRSETFRLLRNGQKLYAEEKVWNAIFVIKQALAEQPAQQQSTECVETVAVVSGYYNGQCVILPIDPARIFNSNTALYTSPPASKPWVGLTDEEITQAFERMGRGLDKYAVFARAIEAKLREKNA